MHFEELWEKCEKFQESNLVDSSSILDELLMKVTLYKNLDSKKDISFEDKKSTKLRLMGEILFTITSLSLKDDINVFKALFISLKERMIE